MGPGPTGVEWAWSGTWGVGAGPGCGCPARTGSAPRKRPARISSQSHSGVRVAASTFAASAVPFIHSWTAPAFHAKPAAAPFAGCGNLLAKTRTEQAIVSVLIDGTCGILPITSTESHETHFDLGHDCASHRLRCNVWRDPHREGHVFHHKSRQRAGVIAHFSEGRCVSKCRRLLRHPRKDDEGDWRNRYPPVIRAVPTDRGAIHLRLILDEATV